MAERPIHVTSTGSDTDGLREFPDGADSGLLIPTHTTAQRNSSPSTGEIAFNSTLGALEFNQNATDVEYLTVSADFAYKIYKIIPL